MKNIIDDIFNQVLETKLFSCLYYAKVGRYINSRKIKLLMFRDQIIIIIIIQQFTLVNMLNIIKNLLVLLKLIINYKKKN